MTDELKEKIIERVRRDHNLTIKKDDPLFAIVTANQISMEEYLTTLSKIIKDQEIGIQLTTENYLNKAKEILEEKLTYMLKELQKEHKNTNQQEQILPKNSYLKQHPILLLTVGIIVGYTIALILL